MPTDPTHPNLNPIQSYHSQPIPTHSNSTQSDPTHSSPNPTNAQPNPIQSYYSQPIPYQPSPVQSNPTKSDPKPCPPNQSQPHLIVAKEALLLRVRSSEGGRKCGCAEAIVSWILKEVGSAKESQAKDNLLGRCSCVEIHHDSVCLGGRGG